MPAAAAASAAASVSAVSASASGWAGGREGQGARVDKAALLRRPGALARRHDSVAKASRVLSDSLSPSSSVRHSWGAARKKSEHLRKVAHRTRKKTERRVLF